jgi:hypothetical protein
LVSGDPIDRVYTIVDDHHARLVVVRFNGHCQRYVTVAPSSPDDPHRSTRSTIHA